ncbi:winged helix-turn-helix domain-containing protein [Streptomyces sp. NPDC026672]|uniref:ArsR/SmtB family transcription factor n=1 Tax=unclassified Streptomyces TaxID=2593676 RepID=UPI0033D2681B
MAQCPDPLWETVCSLHRLQTSAGRWAYADWYRTARVGLAGTPLGGAVRRLLVPMVRRARYFPDFLTPPEAADGLARGLAAIVDTPPERVEREVRRMDLITGAPSWAGRLVERSTREEFTRALRTYYDVVVAPSEDLMRARLDAEGALRARESLAGGVETLLAGLTADARWSPPVLHIGYVEDRDLYLRGRGLLLVPTYFCWQTPITLVDDELQPVLVCPLRDSRPAVDPPQDTEALTALLGRTRAAALRILVHGATTSELARALGVSPGTATHHTTVLRDAGLVTSSRSQNSVLHVLTPLGAAVLRRARGDAGAGLRDTALSAD